MTMREKPYLNFWQIWNMCFGFLGIQIGFALQNANTSRIFQTLGADYNNLPILWLAAPITGLVIQPIIGHMSDKTWGKFGRRRPYFLWGALFASAALIIMPNSPTLWFAASMLWIMDASINVSMEPFRAFVGDMMPQKQRPKGYAMQTFFIGVGAVSASMLPWIMTNWFDVANTAPPGEIPDSVKYAFYVGGISFFLAVAWTVFTTKEYSPEEMAEFEKFERVQRGLSEHATHVVNDRSINKFVAHGVLWFLAGLILTAFFIGLNLDKQLYILSGGCIVFACVQWAVAILKSKNRTQNGFVEVVEDLFAMPSAMRQLAVVQFFSWFALFAMWIYGTAAVAEHHFGNGDPTSAAFAEGADWWGVLSAAYNGYAAIAAIVIPIIVAKVGLKLGHMINLWIGALGFLSFLVVEDPTWLLLSTVGVGFAWASILSLPYSMLSNVLPSHKLGVYMGIFNFFIVLPQILAAAVLGFIITEMFDAKPIYGFAIGGISWFIAGFTVLLVKLPNED
ncbi:major facilitator superfamily transporter [Catenovulum agarivorans DS-2]|uniref:Major facilitator superfamily transporter n=1 Tax=Catenovulum agarivorans DS-2 TaxID=1328313 RepID=W7QS69_9ALTE|nr:MFS transporter [Catenovulum agarivorans]EWH08255.1 major facilitator superfamily transporter [Catenovulum agarivorans DS-2]